MGNIPYQNPIVASLLKHYITTTGRKPRYLRVDNAKEFTSNEMVEYCRDNSIILQPVVAYNHTIQCRVEGAIGCSKQHNLVALVTSGKFMRFWRDATPDFTIKRNHLWAKRDKHGDLSTANGHMQAAFAGTHRTVAIPFGCRVTGHLPLTITWIQMDPLVIDLSKEIPPQR